MMYFQDLTPYSYPRGPTRRFWSGTGELPLVLPPGARAQLGIR
jgi:hypothetical protein